MNFNQTSTIAGDYKLEPPDYDLEPEAIQEQEGPIFFRKHAGPIQAWARLGWFWYDSSVDDNDHGPFELKGDAEDDWDLAKFGDDTQTPVDEMVPNADHLIAQLDQIDLMLEGPVPSMSALACMVRSGHDMAASLNQLKIFGGR